MFYYWSCTTTRSSPWPAQSRRNMYTARSRCDVGWEHPVVAVRGIEIAMRRSIDRKPILNVDHHIAALGQLDALAKESVRMGNVQFPGASLPSR